MAAVLPALVPSTSVAQLGELAPPTSPERPAAHRIVVKFTSPTAARTAAATEAARVTTRAPQSLGGAWYLLSGVDDADTARATLATDPSVRSVQVDHVRHAFGDTYYHRYQPYLRASMDVDQAWRHSSGRGVTVAVVDTGVDPRHKDLPPLLRGHDFVSGDSNATDEQGHGTFVAGVIAAQRDNGRGVAGVSRASILPVRVLNARGLGRDSDIARGIRWAANDGADIINLSLGGPRGSRILHDAVRYATRHGSLVVAASGNSGGTRPMYPAALPQVVAVGATDIHDRMTSFTDHGPWLDLVAPGVKIASTVPGNGYAVGAGTSFSSPLVAGAAALALSDHRQWSVAELRAALLAGAADAGPVGPDPYTGFGILDVDGLVGGPAKGAVGNTSSTRNTTPATARTFDQFSSHSITNTPEGTDTWFRLPVTQPTRVALSARLHDAASGVLRGDVELTLYDSTFRRLDVADSLGGAGRETVHAVVDADVYLRVRNTEDTRWPGRVTVSADRTAATAGHVQTGSATPPTLLASTPAPESYGATTTLPITLTLGSDVAAGSLNARRVRLIDGETGATIARSLAVAGPTLTITPDSPLSANQTYAVTVDGIRTTGGRTLPSVRVGFRTAS